MNKLKLKFTISEFLYFVVLFGFIIDIFATNTMGSWEKGRVSYSFMSDTPAFVKILLFVSCVALMALVFYCFLRYINKTNLTIAIVNVFLVLYFIIWTIISFNTNSVKDVLLSFSTAVILIPLMIYLGFNERIWNMTIKIMPILAIVFIIMTFISANIFWSKYGFVQAGNATFKGFFSAAISSMWLLCLSGRYDKKKFVFVLTILLIIAAFITRSRSWVLQSFLLLLALMITSNEKTSSKTKVLKFVEVLIVISVVFFALTYIFPDLTGALFERGLEDTRTGQYEIFFKKYSFSDLILGCGMNASYSYMGNSNYKYFDNQFIFIMFHYGMPTVVGLLVSYFSLYSKKNTTTNSENKFEIKGAKISILFLFAAYLGLSIFYQVAFDFKAMILMIQLGHALKLKYSDNEVVCDEATGCLL